MSGQNSVLGSNIEEPECTSCGSQWALRISDAPEADDTCDVQASGIYRCGHCKNEYQFLKLPTVAVPLKELVQVTPGSPQVFSPTACCPKCRSFKTKTISVHTVKRYHVCLEQTCRHSFTSVRPPNERLSRR